MIKKILFYFLMCLFPIFFFAGIEGLLRVMHYGENLSLFISSKEYPEYYQLNPNVGKRFFVWNKPTTPCNDRFLIHKLPNTFRIFILGSSTALGFPYDINISFSRMLYYRLKETLPHQRIEVVNTAMAAINSYAIADFIDEILSQKPDAILIYAGHNEYYGALGIASTEFGGGKRWMKKLHLFLVHFRCYQLMRNCIIDIIKILKKESRPPTATLMERLTKDKSILLNSKEYLDGIAQFKTNMREIIQKISKNKVPVLIGELVSNVKDLPPFQSLETSSLPKADEIYCQAKEEEKRGNLKKAKVLFYYAKDLDVIRFRAPEAINEAIYEIANQFNIPVVKLKSIYEVHCRNNIIGNELITEHVHPNIQGYYLMAEAFYNALAENHILPLPMDTLKNSSALKYRAEGGVYKP